MPDTQDRSASPGWEAGPVIDWLLAEGRMLPDMDDLVQRLGQALLAAGAPLWRLRLSMRTLHPLVTAVSAVWEREGGVPMHIESPHGIEQRAGYAGSPLEIIVRTGKPFRKRLDESLSDSDHGVLHDLKARGATDYFGLPMPLSDGARPSLVFVSDRPGGFSESDLNGFARVASVLAPITEVVRLKRIATAVAEAYLGPRTGRRVLDGQIIRGHVERIRAAILFSDIRDWTGLNDRVPAETALTLANQYFEVIAGSVEGQGGEILKFTGDGVLAVFAADAHGADAATACRQSLEAGRQALLAVRDHDPPLDLEFGIGLHFGEVLYGNIGSATRLDFTVLGQAVNIAARIEGLCGTYQTPLLFSQAFADQLNEPARQVAEVELKGQTTATPIFTAVDGV
jgi:adenylate cyclase